MLSITFMALAGFTGLPASRSAFDLDDEGDKRNLPSISQRIEPGIRRYIKSPWPRSDPSTRRLMRLPGIPRKRLQQDVIHVLAKLLDAIAQIPPPG